MLQINLFWKLSKMPYFPASRGLFPPQASSVSATERTWALRPRRVSDAPKRDDDSVVVAILMYKAVNKAAPSKGAAGIVVSVLKRPDRKSVV